MFPINPKPKPKRKCKVENKSEQNVEKFMSSFVRQANMFEYKEKITAKENEIAELKKMIAELEEQEAEWELHANLYDPTTAQVINKVPGETRQNEIPEESGTDALPITPGLVQEEDEIDEESGTYTLLEVLNLVRDKLSEFEKQQAESESKGCSDEPKPAHMEYEVPRELGMVPSLEALGSIQEEDETAGESEKDTLLKVLKLVKVENKISGKQETNTLANVPGLAQVEDAVVTSVKNELEQTQIPQTLDFDSTHVTQ